MADDNRAPEEKIADFEWLVEHRSMNQQSTLTLYKIIAKHKKKLNRSRRHRAAAQMLLGVAFSLWRAVFLCDIKKTKGSLLKDVGKFTEELIQNNTITYVQDRNNRDWTFRYYVQNARSRLKTLNKTFKELGFKFKRPDGSVGASPQEWWLTHQVSLNQAIEQFDKILSEPKGDRS